jgi:lauroyl/myristoyl acyltransferase
MPQISFFDSPLRWRGRSRNFALDNGPSVDPRYRRTPGYCIGDDRMRRANVKSFRIRDLYVFSVLALARIMTWLSSPLLKELVISSIAFAAYHISRNKRQLTEQNLSEAFAGKLTADQKRTIVKGAFYGFWQETFSSLSPGVERSGVKLLGLEHLRGALKNNRGVILWENKSFGRRFVAKQILHENGFPLLQVHAENHLGSLLGDSRPATRARRDVINPFIEACAKQFLAEIIYLPTSDSLAFARTLLDRLRQNAILCVAGDGKMGQKLIPLKFLGRSDVFSTGMVSLAKISGASILPMFCLLESDGKTRLIIERPIQLETGERERVVENTLARYVDSLESYVYKYPDQYRNWHLLRTHYNHCEQSRSHNTHGETDSRPLPE